MSWTRCKDSQRISKGKLDMTAYRCTSTFEIARMNLFGEPIEGPAFKVNKDEVFELSDPAIFGSDHRLVNERGFIEICEARFQDFFEPINGQGSDEDELPAKDKEARGD